MNGTAANWLPGNAVVVDDASDPNLSLRYERICRQHAATYLRSGSWNGIGGARGLGVAHLSSAGVSHVVFVDADDELLPIGMRAKVAAASDDMVVAGPYEIVGRYAEPYVADTSGLVALANRLGAHPANPVLYTNIVGHGAVVPLAGLHETDFPTRCYSGEFVTLWGQVLLSGRMGVIHADGPPAYRYEVRPEGNYSRDVRRHRAGVCAAFSAIRRMHFREETEYGYVASGGRRPSLYAPVVAGRRLLPEWCTAGAGRPWTFTDGLPREEFRSREVARHGRGAHGHHT